MAYNVKFLKGTWESFNQLLHKDPNTFYYLDESLLYLGDKKLTNAADVEEAITQITGVENELLALKARVDSMTGGGSGNTNEELAAAVNMIMARLGVVEDDLKAETSRATAAENKIAGDLASLITRVNDLSLTVEGNKTATDEQVASLDNRVSSLETNMGKYDAAIGSLLDKTTANEQDIQGLKGTTEELNGIVNTLVGGDVDKSVRTVALEVLSEQLLADGATENFETLQELAAWLADHPEEAAEMNLAIQQHSAQLGALQDTSNAHTATIESLQEQINSLSSGDSGLLSQAKDYTDQQIQVVNEALNQYKNSVNTTLANYDERITNNETAIAAINDPTSGLLAQAQAKLEELKKSFGTAAYKNVEDFDAAGSAAAALAQAQAYTDEALTWGVITIS